jgi:hypothetical protein
MEHHTFRERTGVKRAKGIVGGLAMVAMATVNLLLVPVRMAIDAEARSTVAGLTDSR